MDLLKSKAFADVGDSVMGRSTFLKYTGAAAGGIILLDACKKDNNVTNPSGVNLGSGDTGLLNYAYALEQLEAAFYTQVVASFYTNATQAEKDILADIKAHEIVHREFLKAALGSNAIQALEVNFSTIDFTSRASVLGTAKVFEDLGVSAYNGAGQLFSNTTTGNTYLGLAGKIVSIEARHAAAIRDLLNPKSADFAGDDQVAASSGLDKENAPLTVLSSAAAFLKTALNASNLPTS